MAVDKAEKQSERVLQRSSRLGAEEQTGAKGAARIPFEELYYYPGDSYSPLHELLPPDPSFNHRAISSLHRIATLIASDIDTDDEADTPGISLAFYTLRKNKQGGWDIVLVILEAEDGDERAEAMERCLYPGATLHLPPSLYISKSHTYFPLTPSSSSLSHRPTTPPLLVPDLQSSLHPNSQLIKLSFRHPAIPSAVADQARKEGVLGGWTRKEWGRAMRSGDTAIREWKSVMIRKLKSTDTK